MNVMPHTAMPVISVEKLRVTAQSDKGESIDLVSDLSLIHISEPTRPVCSSRMPSSA